VQIGEPHDIYEHPNSRFVADFVGSVNMFEGRVVEDADDHVRIRSEEAACDIQVGHGVSCAPNQTLWFAIRPEKITLSREKLNGDANTAKGTVEDIAYMGNLSVYRVMLDSGKRITVTKANAKRSDDDAIRWDETVYANWGDASGVVLPS
ncbi:MAG: TOBE domain-containing protein, partial [Geminicoccaceae bacterium]